MVKGTDTQRIFRPHGSGDWLFLYFPVPMKFYLSDKTEASSEKDACVIYAPHDYHSFGGFPHFQNSYVHFSCSDDEIKKFSFRTGELFYTSNFGEMNRLVQKIKDEMIESSVMSKEMLNSLVMQLLITAERSFGGDKDETKEAFEQLRYDMLEHYDKNYSASYLASRMCMSKSRFYEKYRQYFGQSPKQELIKIRMETARVLLTNVNSTVSEVAQRVGFESAEHFSRYYRKYFGETPKNRTKHHL